MKKQVRASKYDPLMEEVELLQCNPEYAHVRMNNGRETTVSLRHLAPTGERDFVNITDNRPSMYEHCEPDNVEVDSEDNNISNDATYSVELDGINYSKLNSEEKAIFDKFMTRRSTRESKAPDRL